MGGGSARTDANEAPAAPAAPVRTCPLISTQRGCYCVATVKWPLHNGITRRLAGYIVYVSGVSTYCSPLQEHERQRSHPQQLTSLASNPRVHLGLHVSAKRNKKEQKKKKDRRELLRCYGDTTPFTTRDTPKGKECSITYISPCE